MRTKEEIEEELAGTEEAICEWMRMLAFSERLEKYDVIKINVKKLESEAKRNALKWVLEEKKCINVLNVGVIK